MPRKRAGVFSKLRNHRAHEGQNLSLHARARLIMNQRRTQLRAKQWHGGKQYVGRRLSGHAKVRKKSTRVLSPAQKAHLAALHARHRSKKHPGLSTKQMAQANYLKYGKVG